MRTLLCLALSLPLFCLHSNAAYRDVIEADQPVGYWRLGDPAGSAAAANSGSLGAAANGTPVGNVTFEFPGALSADADTAINLDGAQSKIDVPFAPELNTGAFTVEAWANVAFGSLGYRSPVASRDDNPQRGFIFYADPSENWQFWTGTGEQVGWNIVGGAFVEQGAWAHLVGTYDGANKLFYVNGVLVGGNQSAFTPNGARVLRIGGSATESPIGDFFFNGEVDEVAVYNKALPPDRVLAHYTAGSAIAPDPFIFPAFAVQPVPTNNLFKSETVTLTAIATGSLPLTYQWMKDDVDVPGATNFFLTLTNLQPADGGTYTLIARNTAGEILSDPALLDVADVTVPVITQQPRPRTVLPGSPAGFSVQAIGSTSFEYQWQFDGQDITGATNSTLSITNTQSGQLGAYKVIVRNPAGSTESDSVTLSFPSPATLSYAETIAEDSPVAYWRLDESTGDIAADSVGANDGFLLNGVTLGRPGALVDDTNTAAGFEQALSTKIDVSWSDVLNPPVFTVSLWAKVTGGTGHRSPLTSRADFPQRGYIFYAEPGNTWQFWIGSSEPAGWVSVPGPAVQPNTYAHLVGVYDGTNVFFYVNGILAGQRTGVLAINDQSPLRIGAGATEGDGNFFFEGDIDEVALFNTALSEERILAHYVAGFPLTTPPSIVTQPTPLVAPPGATVSFSVTAAGGLPLNYQWRFDSEAIANATNNILTLSNVTSLNAGAYTVVVSNSGGSVTSSVANLNIPVPSTKPYVQLVREDDPTGYWRLGEIAGDIADDEIGINDGFILNGVTLGIPGAIPGDTNTAAGFSAALTQMIDIPWSDTLNAPVFSAEVWAKVTGAPGTYRSPLTSRADGPQRGYIFYATPANIWQFWSGRGDTSGWDAIGGPAVVTNKWTHLAATYDGTIKRFFVDGVEVATSTGAFGINDFSVLRIGAGASEGPGNYFFEGEVDEAAVYDHALTHEQIILHFLAGAPKTASLDIARGAAGITLNWESGTLQSAPSVTGPWSAVPNAQAPHEIVIGTERAAFYRLLVQP